jgi:hypothetical protein
MALVELIDNNGIAVLLAYMAIVLVAGTIPPLPADASFWEKWGYGIIKGIALNSRAISNSLGLKLMPELELPSVKRAKLKEQQALCPNGHGAAGSAEKEPE